MASFCLVTAASAALYLLSVGLTIDALARVRQIVTLSFTLAPSCCQCDLRNHLACDPHASNSSLGIIYGIVNSLISAFFDTRFILPVSVFTVVPAAPDVLESPWLRGKPQTFEYLTEDFTLDF